MALDDLLPLYAGIAAAVAAAGGCGWLLGRRWRPVRTDPRRLGLAVLCVGAVFAALFASLAGLSLHTFHKYFDTAVEVQTIRNIAAGRGPVSSVNAAGMRDADRNASYLAYHACLAYYPVSLLYRLLPSPTTVVVLGALCVAAAVWPVYRLSLAALGPSGGALIPPLVYCLHPTVQYTMVWEFHALSLAVPCLAWATWFAERGRAGRFWIAGLLLLSVREDAALMGVFLGLFAGFGPLRRHGFAFATLAVLYFVAATQVWMPALSSRGAWYQAHLYAHLGTSLPEILRGVWEDPARLLRLLAQPPRVGNAVLFFLPLAFLPFAAGRWLWLFLPYFGLLFLGRDLAFYSIFMYYAAPLLPALAASAAVGAARVGRADPARRRAALGALLAASAAASVLLGAAPWSVQFWSRAWRLAPFKDPYFHVSSYRPTERVERIRAFLDRVPRDARVAAAHYFLPHLVDCRRLYALIEPYVPGDVVDYVVFDRTRANLFVDTTYETITARYAAQGFRVVVEEDGLVLLARGDGAR